MSDENKSDEGRQKTAIIIGAGPAGLTAAYELLQHSDVKPVVYEIEKYCGGLSATLEYKGNGIDIGGHRFYSKSDWVMNWWTHFLPIAEMQGHVVDNVTHDDSQPVLRMHKRLSRILFMGKLFEYPLTLSWQTFKKVPATQLLHILFSYLKAKCFPIKPENNLEAFYINRFGSVLYKIFFKSYTEKVWGVACDMISPDWGPQRIKGVSVLKVLLHAVRQAICQDFTIGQKSTDTSLIERFLYPDRGPGQLWQTVANEVLRQGGEIHYNHVLVGIHLDNDNVCTVDLLDRVTNQKKQLPCDYLISTMPIKDLVTIITGDVPDRVKDVAMELCYRDLIIVCIALKKSSKPIAEETCSLEVMQDNWLYIQEPGVKLGRVQIYSNWSRAMVTDVGTLWVGLEYFCQEGDSLWQKSNEQMARFAVGELEKTGLASGQDVFDYTVIKIKKAYPAYFGSYDQIDIVRKYLNSIGNLYSIGRNGMHRYNNQDHSMLSARAAVNCLVTGSKDKSAIWQVNAEDEYLES